MLKVKRSKKSHGPLWSRPKYYSQISHTQNLRYISQKATTLRKACISHPSQDGVLFEYEFLNSAFENGRQRVWVSYKCLKMLSFYDPFWTNEYSFKLTGREAKQDVKIAYSIL
jgi:hypothetical protein